jgi:ribosomal protein S18 acetylase RimI-like enzyme
VELNVRRAVPADLARVSDIFREASLSNEGDRPLLAAHPEFLVFEPAAIEEGRTLVAVAHGEVRGFVTTHVDGDVWEVVDLFVDPAWMRRGIATRLMADAAAAARSGGATRIEVTANGHALDFYKSAGFVLGHEIELEYGHGYRMQLAVSRTVE